MINLFTLPARGSTSGGRSSSRASRGCDGNDNNVKSKGISLISNDVDTNMTTRYRYSNNTNYNSMHSTYAYKVSYHSIIRASRGSDDNDNNDSTIINNDIIDIENNDSTYIYICIYIYTQ